ncbi:uncharacterized protein MONOS_11742 [Monocercomonoides exilis]|uniref:uncharacterized protein n=1 Tax=Monocercomonoides exilis TaxID=2049356 RepID=UPI00355A38F3|nr:hypothetical protein MONOS_11742 [Monocercomonoides exilis]|eukprot:MONOS_11742.1-p1 / transcript=MONOS_11742.1 / gene=MONOS_11742 / organism=Monocercomonoides_exilis_PA203 / gene_product=unspecified product / transcript_product=unspecified product / location=Mono_scaffold00607:12104-12798(-) / protein_length=157 / sequence_SO=supercontig / SO=protein_coding / is_pseudo=false
MNFEELVSQIKPLHIAIGLASFWLLFSIYYLRFIPKALHIEQPPLPEDEAMAEAVMRVVRSMKRLITNEVKRRTLRILFGICFSLAVVFYPFSSEIAKYLPHDSNSLLIIRSVSATLLAFYIFATIYDSTQLFPLIESPQLYSARQTDEQEKPKDE